MKSREELNKRLKEVKELIKHNSKDAHYTSELLTELISIKGSLDTHPLAVDCGTPLEGKVFKGETFEIILTTKGALYHTYGGYNVFVEPSNKALYEAMFSIVEEQGYISLMDGEDKENVELFFQAFAYVMNCPLFALANDELLFNVAECIIKSLRVILENATEMPLQEETVEQDREFKEAVLGMEKIQASLKES